MAQLDMVSCRSTVGYRKPIDFCFTVLLISSLAAVSFRKHLHIKADQDKVGEETQGSDDLLRGPWLNREHLSCSWGGGWCRPTVLINCAHSFGKVPSWGQLWTGRTGSWPTPHWGDFSRRTNCLGAENSYEGTTSANQNQHPGPEAMWYLRLLLVRASSRKFWKEVRIWRSAAASECCWPHRNYRK